MSELIEDPKQLIGRVLVGKIQLQSLVWVGLDAAIFMAYDTILEREVAAKVLLPGPIEFRQVDILRFRRKGVLLARLSHAHIPRVYEGGEDPETGLHYLVMEWVLGRLLLDFLDLPYDEGQILSLACDLSSALESAHVQEILHRDIRPDNIVLSTLPNGSLKATLIEFGVEEAPGTRPMDQPGWGGYEPSQLAYMSPEHLRGEHLDKRSDVYALGVLLYQLVTGDLPFRGTPENIMQGHLERRAPSIKAKAGFDMPPILKALIGRCLNKEPDQRFPDASAVHDLVSNLLVERAGRQLDAITALTVDPLDRYIIVGRAGGVIDVHRVSDGRRLHTFDDHGGAVKALIFRPDSEDFLSVGEDGHIHLWSIPEGKLYGTWPGRRGARYALAFSPFGYIFASGEVDGRIRLWSILEREPLGEFQAHHGPVSALHFLPEGRFLASGGHDGRILLWDIGRMSLSESCAWSRGPVTQIAMHVRERFVVALADGTLAHGRWNRQEPLWHRRIHDRAPSHLFEQHGTQGVISIGLDGAVHVVDQFDGSYRRASLYLPEGIQSAVLHPLTETLFLSSESLLLRWTWSHGGEPVLEGYLPPGDRGKSGWRG